MRGCLGWVTLLLLVAAAALVMTRSGTLDAWLGDDAPSDSLAGRSGVVLDPRVQPYPTPRPTGDSPTADRLLRDVEGMGTVPTP